MIVGPLALLVAGWLFLCWIGFSFVCFVAGKFCVKTGKVKSKSSVVWIIPLIIAVVAFYHGA